MEWQHTQDFKAKFELIYPHLRDCRNVLDVGCNAGEITRLCGDAGLFAVGIDQKVNYIKYKNACIGEIALTADKIDSLPRFDAILLLSVLHQLITENGHDYARNYVAKLAQKAEKRLIIELAAVNSKYGKIKAFEDNDETSVIAWFMSWLSDGLKCNYIGKAAHNRDNEPYRFLFEVAVER